MPGDQPPARQRLEHTLWSDVFSTAPFAFPGLILRVKQSSIGQLHLI